MVFTKLTDIQKQNLFELKQTLPPSTISSMRALIMRGASVEEAKKSVEERQKAKQEYLDQMDKEIEAMKEKKKAKAPEPPPEPAPEPKKKRASKKVAVDTPAVETQAQPIASSEGGQLPVEGEKPKAKRGKAKAKADEHTLAITL